ncbi:ABC transporter ATP-binding protein, partial [Paenibacillus sp. SSG-1]|uniref:ABC transporter permease n=1 Tax=Paenibacillus sp. SSG-1 TaxID=1443669 RepID=UPI00211AF313
MMRGPGSGGMGRGKPVKPKNFRRTMGRLWRYFGRERKLLSLIMVFIIIDAGVTLIGPFLIGKSIDAMSANQGRVAFGLLQSFIIVLATAYITDVVLVFLQGWLMAGVSQRIVAGLRRSLFQKLQKLPVSYFDARSHGEVMSRLTNDIDNVSQTVSQSTTQLMAGGIAIIGSLVMMIVLSPILTLASLITVPILYLLTRTVTRKTSVLFKEQQVQLGMLNGHIEETISGMEVVKAFNHEHQAINEFEAVNGRLFEVGLKAQIRSGFMMPLMNVINNIGFAAVALVGGILAVKSLITVGVIASFLSYSRQFVRPLNDLANIYNLLQSGVAGGERG